MKRTVAILLVLLLTLTMPACAASAPSAAEATVESMMVVAAAEKIPFSDVPDSAWYAEALRVVSERGIMNDAGDVILYQGRQFVIYYDRNSYSLTPLGRITGMAKAELQALLGADNVTATLSLALK